LINGSNILVDTDAGVDDILALFCLLQMASPSNVDAAITFGNVSLSQAISNVALFISISRLAPRMIWRGSSGPLSGPPHFATDVHGNDGLGDVTKLPSWQPPVPEPRNSLFTNTLLGQYGKVITLGPLTNVARIAPELNASAPPLIVMGGAFDVRGNVTVSSEFNFYSDPAAANYMFKHYDGEIFVVSLDVCNTIVLERAYLRRICSTCTSRTATFLNLIHQHYMDFYRHAEGIDGCHPHDALAVFAAMIPDMFTWKRGHVHVLAEGHERGRSLFEPHPSGRHHLALSVDAARFFEVLENTICGFKDGGASS
jgi:purine nucleosidase